MKTRILGSIGLAVVAFVAGFAAAPAGFNRDRAIVELSHCVTIYSGLKPIGDEWTEAMARASIQEGRDSKDAEFLRRRAAAIDAAKFHALDRIVAIGEQLNAK